MQINNYHLADGQTVVTYLLVAVTTVVISIDVCNA